MMSTRLLDNIQILINGTVDETDVYIERRPGAQAGLLADDICLNVYWKLYWVKYESRKDPRFVSSTKQDMQ